MPFGAEEGGWGWEVVEDGQDFCVELCGVVVLWCGFFGVGEVGSSKVSVLSCWLARHFSRKGRPLKSSNWLRMNEKAGREVKSNSGRRALGKTALLVV